MAVSELWIAFLFSLIRFVGTNVIVVVALHLSFVNFVSSLTVKSFHNMLVDDCECVHDNHT